MKSTSIVTILALITFACTTTTTETSTLPTDPVDAGTEADKDKDKDKDPPKPPVVEEEEEEEEETCADTSDGQSCFLCCSDQEPQGAQIFLAAEEECICAEVTCAEACATTYCAETPANPDSACIACLQQESVNQHCNQVLSERCGASQSCINFYMCTTESGCYDK